MAKLLRGSISPKSLSVVRRINSWRQPFVKLVADWILPPRFAHLGQRIYLEIASRPNAYESSILQRNAKFRNMYAGRRCFVIGNGPSLNKQDLTPLANEVTIVMNQFNMHPIINQWKPTFFCMAEPRENMKPEDLPLFLEGIEAQAYFYRIEFKEIFDKNRFVDPEKVYYLKMWGLLASRSAIDLSRTIPGCRTTAHMALMLALYLGCSPIYLIGLDHDWLAHRSVERHFYASSASSVGASDDLSTYSYKSMVEGTLHTWRIYESLNDIASKQGISIYNATAGGFLDVFPRADFASLFPSMHK